MSSSGASPGCVSLSALDFSSASVGSRCVFGDGCASMDCGGSVGATKAGRSASVRGVGGGVGAGGAWRGIAAGVVVACAVDEGVSSSKQSSALKTVWHCPQRTLPARAFNCGGVMRKTVAQRGQRVFMRSPWSRSGKPSLRGCQRLPARCKARRRQSGHRSAQQGCLTGRACRLGSRGRRWPAPKP